MSLRHYYERQLILLQQEAKEPAGNPHEMSNRDLLETINYYLKHFNCQTISIIEMAVIIGKMEEL